MSQSVVQASALYTPTDIERLKALLDKHRTIYGTRDGERFFSAPGRAEISGNHTDHNLGIVLAAAVTLDTLAVVSPREDNVVELISEGFTGAVRVDLNDLNPRGEEKNKTPALIRGVAAGMKKNGHNIGGFNATVTSKVLTGSGMSSSAAFEVCLAAIMDGMFNGGTISPVEKAMISQYAENVFFGKPSGLMDQTASAVGGMVMIDFKEKTPQIKTAFYDFEKAGYLTAVIDTKSSHDDLTDDYAAIPAEMRSVAAVYGQQVLRFVDSEAFERDIPSLRETVTDRAILRSRHFFDENKRVVEQFGALERGDTQTFLSGVLASGFSSQLLLQNITPSHGNKQSVALALYTVSAALGGRGAFRIHGGGFAGTILAFIPTDALDAFKKGVSPLLGDNAVTVFGIRKWGECEVRL